MASRRVDHFRHDRPNADDPAVVRLAGAIAPGAERVDLGGTMSLNVELRSAGLVLRIHRPWVSRARVEALQAVRARLADAGLAVAAARPWRGATVFRCGRGWAEVEPFLPAERAEATPESYRRMFAAMGALHRALAGIDVAVPRPAVATYGPPASLARWLADAEAAVADDPAAVETLRWVRALVARLRRRWPPASALPGQLVHGDVRLSNVRETADGTPVYFDFGFLAHRPRVHDLAYALAWIALRPDGRGTAAGLDRRLVADLLAAYEDTAGAGLTPVEHDAIGPYLAAVPLYLAAIAGYVPDPVEHLRNPTRLVFLRIAEDVLSGASI